ncbi:MAG: endolytic transglycosylase MltG [Clostridia bacterium]|nr:endolytic transglycosylase MltG [Clostridia bacterium]
MPMPNRHPTTRRPASSPGRNLSARRSSSAEKKEKTPTVFDKIGTFFTSLKEKVFPKKEKSGKEGETGETRSARKKKLFFTEEFEKEPESAFGNTVLGITKTFTYIACVIVAGAALAIAIVLVGNDVFGLVKPDKSVTITIPKNASVKDVGQILYDNGCISFPKMFELYCSFRKESGDFLAGEYTVSTAWDYDDYRYEFKEKEPEGTIRLMISEGSTVDEIIQLFVSNGIGTKEGFVKAINEGEFEYWFIDELTENGWSSNRFYRLEGYLFPDTYDFYLASSEWSVINKLLRRFNEIYNESMKTRAKTLGMTTDQVVTLASMVEKEAYYASDLSTISSVFHNRLTNSALFPYLQSDATIAYAMQHDLGTRPADSDISTSYVSPYNTYLYRGLPPGPIANPGYASLASALYPSKTNYYYFVSYPSGYTLYATTLEEHNANVKLVADAKKAQSQKS